MPYLKLRNGRWREWKLKQLLWKFKPHINRHIIFVSISTNSKKRS